MSFRSPYICALMYIKHLCYIYDHHELHLLQTLTCVVSHKKSPFIMDDTAQSFVVNSDRIATRATA